MTMIEVEAVDDTVMLLPIAAITTITQFGSGTTITTHDDSFTIKLSYDEFKRRLQQAGVTVL